MGFFSKRPKSPSHLPEPYLRGLRDFGENAVGQRPNFNRDLLADLDVMDFAQQDPEGFVEMLAASIGRYSDAYCLGAATAVTGFHSIDVVSPGWDRIVDGAIEFSRRNGVPYKAIKPYMRDRWEQSHSPDEW